MSNVRYNLGAFLPPGHPKLDLGQSADLGATCPKIGTSAEKVVSASKVDLIGLVSNAN